MSNAAWIVIIVLALTLLGALALAFVTIKYYWGERGVPPLTGEERRRHKQEELRLRARQIERANRRPINPRKTDFWDNTKA